MFLSGHDFPDQRVISPAPKSFRKVRDMKTITGAIAALCLTSLAACGQSPEEAAGDLAEEEISSRQDVVEEEADLAGALGNDQREDALDEHADRLGDVVDDATETAEARMEQRAE